METDEGGTDIDAGVANVARVYNAATGGKDAYGEDREFVLALEGVLPGATQTLRANREFVGRAVEYLAGRCGMTQFIDLGSGLPRSPNVHEVVRGATQEGRVLYVDHDPVVATHGRALLADHDRTGIFTCDIVDARAIIEHAKSRGLIDFDRPIVLMACAVLHFIEGETAAAETIGAFRHVMAPGSYVVISHALRSEASEKGAAIYSREVRPITLRTAEQIAGLFAGFDLIEPGLTGVGAWHAVPPDEAAGTAAKLSRVGESTKDAEREHGLAAVACLRE